MTPEVTVASAAIPAPRRAGAYLTLDAWRGIASIAVVFFHWSELALRRWPQLENNALYNLSAHGNLGVQLFFVISGYCIANAGVVNLERAQGLKKFLYARARRIYPTYWAGLLFSLSVLYVGYLLAQRGLMPQNIFTQANPLQLPFTAYLANLTLTTSLFKAQFMLMVAWTLCYELAFYLIVAGGMALGRTPIRMMTLLHAVTVGSLVWLIVSPFSCPYPLNLWPQFGFGVLVYDWVAGAKTGDKTSDSGKTAWVTVIGALTIALIGWREFPVNYWVNSSRLAYAVSLGFALLLAMLYRRDAALSRLGVVRVLGTVGVFSYSLYLTHTVTIRLFSQLVQRMSLPVEAHWLIFGLATFTAIVVAYGFFLLFEKPFLRSGKRPAKVGASVPSPSRDVERARGARETAA